MCCWDECWMYYVVIIIAIVVLIIGTIYSVIESNAQDEADRSENKSGSGDYLYKRYEIPNAIGGTNLDRFFVECVLAECNDFTLEKNIEKAKLLADKYNLSYESGIETLYNNALKEHKKISNIIDEEKLEKLRENERAEYEQLIKYAEYYGFEKKKTMLTDMMRELQHRSEVLDDGREALMRNSQQRESDWAIWGGIADGLAGPGAGVATALEIQAENEKIRAQNKANRKALMPTYVTLLNTSARLSGKIKDIKKEIDALNEKLISDASSDEVMDMLEIVNSTVQVSRTGAYKITATVKAKEDLFIYGDVPAVADGTIEAHLFDGTDEVGTAKMVLPVDGISEEVDIAGIGLTGAKARKKYSVKFTGYKLWLMEQ